MSDFKFQGDPYYYSSKLNLQEFGSHLHLIRVSCMTSAMLPAHTERRVWPNIFKTIGIVCDTTKSTHTDKIFHMAFLSIKVFRLHIVHSHTWPFSGFMSMTSGHCSNLKQFGLRLYFKGQGRYFWVFKKSVWYNDECRKDLAVPREFKWNRFLVMSPGIACEEIN